MTIPKELPKSAETKNTYSEAKSIEVSVATSKFSIGQTTVEGSGRFSLPSFLWRSESSIDDSAYGDEETRDEDENENENNQSKAFDDNESFPSNFSNSIFSTSTASESISLTGTDSTGTVQSNIYETREIQRRQPSRSQLPEIPEDKILDDLNCQAIPSSTSAKNNNYWGRFWKRSASKKKSKQREREEQSVVIAPRLSEEAKQARSPINQSTRAIAFEENSLVDTDFIRTEEGPSTKEIVPNDGWDSVLSWFSNIEESSSPVQSVAKQNIPEGRDDDSQGNPLEGSYLKPRAYYYTDLPPVEGKRKTIAENQGILSNTNGDSKGMQRRGIPSILPLPRSRSRSKKESIQEQQRQRIFSLLRSEGSESSNVINTKRSLVPGAKPILKHRGDLHPKKGIPLGSEDLVDEPLESNEFNLDSVLDNNESERNRFASPKNDPEESSMQSSAMTTCVKESGTVDAIDAGDSVQYTGTREGGKVAKNDLGNMVNKIKAERKAERMIHQMNNRVNLEVGASDLRVNQQDLHLGNKKSWSTLEEKRLLKVLHRFVKKRLHAIEEIEKESAEDKESTSTACCGLFSF